jgi:alcohol dehydrogenase class IV
MGDDRGIQLESCEFEFRLRTHLHFGAGKALQLGRILKEVPYRRIGIILDPGVAGQPYMQQVLEGIRKEAFEDIRVWTYDLKEEPDYDALDRVKPEFMTGGRSAVDCFIGIGGGSVIDFAKGLATLAVNPGPALSFRGFPAGLTPSLPIVAVPTTAGTGSEVTYNAVFIDRAGKRKLGINTEHNFPALAVLDPLLVVSSPERVTISTGIDGLVHAIESYGCRRSNPLTMVFAREGFAHVYSALERIPDAPHDTGVRAHLQLGAYLAGISLMNAGSGPAGALSYPLGVHFGVAHGLAGGVFLPPLVAHNVERGFDYSALHDAIAPGDRHLPQEEKNRSFAWKIQELCQKLGIPDNLRVFGVNPGNVHLILADIDSLGPAFAQNPVDFSVDDGKRLVMRMSGSPEPSQGA